MIEEYKVGIYLRLSKEDEKKGESTSISNQRDIINQYIRKNDLKFVGEYIDDGISGTRFDDRDAWNKLIEDIENKKINMIITKDLSRFGRNEAQQLRYIDYFEEKGVRYVSILDNIDTYDELNVSNEMMSINMFFNEKHVRDTSKKLKASLYSKRSSGNFLGTYPPYGYKKDKENKYKLVIDEESSKVVKRIFNLYIQGNSINKICMILTKENIPIPSVYNNYKRANTSTIYGKWGSRTVSDILRLPTYVGDLTQGRTKKVSYKSKRRIHTKEDEWIICKDSCPAIIDRQTFIQVKKLQKVNKYKTNNNSDILLKGIVYCKECNHKISFRKHKTSTKKEKEVIRIYGNCNYWAKNKYLKPCTPHNIKYKELEDVILNDIKSNYKNKINKVNLIRYLEKIDKSNKIEEEIKVQEINLIQQNKNIEYKKEQVYKDKLDGLIDSQMYQKIVEQLISEVSINDEKIKKINKQLKGIKKYSKDKVSKYEKIVENIFSLEKVDSQLLMNLVEKVEVDENNNIDIYYKFKK